MAWCELRRLAYSYTSDRLKAGLIRPSTARQEWDILGRLVRFFDGRAPESIGRDDVLAWMGTHQGCAQSTRRMRFSIARSFFDHLLEVERINRNPFRTVKAPKVPPPTPRAISHEDAGRLLAACTEPRIRLAVILGLQLGLRRAEIAGVQLQDFDWSRRLLAVRGKGGNGRRVPLPDQAVEEVLAYLTGLGVDPGDSGPLLRSNLHPHRGISPNRVGDLVRQACWDAGIKGRAWDGVSTHALRHTAATDVHRATKDVLTVRDFLGHANLATTQTYLRGLDLDSLRVAVEGRRY